MTPEPTTPATPLLGNLRARQLESRTAKVARALEEPARVTGGAFNANAAAVLNNWKEP